MRCIGITKAFKRCKNSCSFFNCRVHRWQPFTVFFTICVIIGVYAGLYQDLYKHLFDDKKQLRLQQEQVEQVELHLRVLINSHVRMGVKSAVDCCPLKRHMSRSLKL